VELGSGEWGMVFPILRRQSGGKCQECSQSPVRTGITAERFYLDFENKILATRGEWSVINCGPLLLGWLVLNCRLSEKERKTYIISCYPMTGIGGVCGVVLTPGRSLLLLAVPDFRCFSLFGTSSLRSAGFFPLQLVNFKSRWMSTFPT